MPRYGKVMSRYGKFMPFYTKIWRYVDQDMPMPSRVMGGYRQDLPSFAKYGVGTTKICHICLVMAGYGKVMPSYGRVWPRNSVLWVGLLKLCQVVGR